MLHTLNRFRGLVLTPFPAHHAWGFTLNGCTVVKLSDKDGYLYDSRLDAIESLLAASDGAAIVGADRRVYLMEA